YDSITYKQPFWAENSGFMTGRDPLGIQNSSITVYASLLPGMTNLTLRLRYYGLYCWLLNEYGKLDLESEKKTLQHHYSFIRRAELTIAFLMLNRDPEVTSIVGSDFAGRHLQEFRDRGSFRISEGADKLKSTVKGTVYWDYTSGALGQYYAGSLISLDLIETNNKFFIIREKGVKLAKAFETNINKRNSQASNVFLEILRTGNLNLGNLYILDDFSITNIPQDSTEWEFYKSMLLENDGQKTRTSDNKVPSNRKETISLFLKFITATDKDWFPEQQFLKVNAGDTTSDSSFGWYYYYINEAIHYCIETLFWGMLVELEGKSLPIHQFISDMASSIIRELRVLYYQIDEDNTIGEVTNKLPVPDLPEALDQLEDLTKSPRQAFRAMGFALDLFLEIFNLSREFRERIKDFENKYYLVFQKGHINEFFKDYIDNHLELSLSDYTKLLVKKIINDHIATAYRKMGNGESNLVKFVIEDGMIGHIQTMTPRFTTPRLRTLQNFLTDLGFITSSNEVTESGKELIEEIASV
ncbi:MAG: hypothetical protein ACTSRU_13225, partial [Candidatus Hodarchaeales archaeon]